MSGFVPATMIEWFVGQMGVEDHLSFSPWVSFETGYISILSARIGAGTFEN